MKARILLLLVSLLLIESPGWPHEAGHHDEGKVPPYTLPDPLLDEGGQRVSSAEQWRAVRRPRLLDLFTSQVYGRAPAKALTWTARQSSQPVFAGKAVRTLVDLKLACEGREQTWSLLIYRPPGEGPWPVFLGMNFLGNQTVYPDGGIPLSRGWVMDSPEVGIEHNRASEESRGSRSGRWPVEAIVARGYALCTLCYGDVEPDVEEGFGAGAHALVGAGAEWGAVATWAWGLSRVADFLEQQPWCDRIAVMGHSRLGKAALWAGATDQRFGLAISNDSGCAGAALSKRIFGETVAMINDGFPHWFTPAFRRYNDNEAALPIDQHELLAMLAGRAVYVASARSDLHADPEGERLSVEAARPVFALVGGAIGYHLRPGQHEVTPYDWERFMDFAVAHWRHSP
jgi:hypothetical protein